MVTLNLKIKKKLKGLNAQIQHLLIEKGIKIFKNTFNERYSSLFLVYSLQLFLQIFPLYTDLLNEKDVSSFTSYMSVTEEIERQTNIKVSS